MEHTKELIRRAQAGDSAAADLLIAENTGLIHSVAARFRGRGTDPEDLYQIGAIGFLKCIEHFDFSYDVRLSTYAVPMILGELRRFFRDNGAVKVSRSLKELAWHAAQIREKLLTEENREPTVEELALLLNTTREELILAAEAGREVESLDAPLSHQEDGTALRLMDKLPSPEHDSFLVRLSLTEAIKTLEKTEQQIITLRYFRDQTQSETAKYIGISQVQVSRIEKRVLKRLRKEME